MSAAVVSCCHPSPVFQLCEHVFDQMALFIQMPVVRWLWFPVLLWWNTGGDAPLCERLSDFIAVVSPITDDFLCLIRQIQQQRISAFKITDLSRSQMKPDGSALIIAHGMKF